MPRLSVYFIRTALIYLALGFTFGGLMLFNKGVPFDPQIWRLLPLHIELVLIGWTVQLAMGVAFWVLPRFSRGRARGDERPAWLAYVLLNTSIVGIALSQWLAWPDGFTLASRLIAFLAVICFTIHAWPRVKSLGT